MYPVYEYMQEYGLPLSVHAEMPGANTLEAERLFLPVIYQIIKDFPNLKVIIEHVSSEDAIKAVLNLPDTVAATITVHHLLFTIQDVIGGKMRPHRYCMPIPKMQSDKDAIIAAATSGNPKFFFGSDSAPHFRETKETAEGAAGVFTTPVIAPLLAYIFEKEDKLEKLENFTSRFGAEYYGLERINKTITLTDDESTFIPADFAGIVPIMDVCDIPWKIKKIDNV